MLGSKLEEEGIDTVEDARACLAVADAIVVRPGLAAKLAAELVGAGARD